MDNEFISGVGMPYPEPFVCSLTVQADGKILVAGRFTTLGGQMHTNIGRLNADGTPDNSFKPGTPGTYGLSYPFVSWVSSLAVQADGKILVGGWFTNLCGKTRNYLGRLNADGTLDSGFTPGASSGVYSLAVQPDGKILVGGNFWELGGQMRSRIGRLNADGTLDSGFNPGASSGVDSLTVQADGKILVGGGFTRLGGQPCYSLGRLNSDGTLDTGFNPEKDLGVGSLALQADGKILVGGEFTTLGGQSRNHLGRLNADGTVDSNFDPGANRSVYSLAVQADGKILVGGYFANLGGQWRTNIARLNNTELATQSLRCNGSTITWLRGGTSPEVWRTTIEGSSDGVAWTYLGAGERIPGGWRLTGVSLPSGDMLRARGFAVGGIRNASGWFVETLGPEPQVSIQSTGHAAFSVLLKGPNGFPWALQTTTNLSSEPDWQTIWSGFLTNGTQPLSWTNGAEAARFFRVRHP